MVLQRLSRALREQNWFTVVIEILVVVIGILVGLQVDDWNENRKTRGKEAIYLSRLYDDLKVTQSELSMRIERNETALQRMTAALRALEACDSSIPALDEVQYALVRYQVSPPINMPDATYDEMVATGALARLPDQELKQSIAYTYSALTKLNTDFQNFRISVPNVDNVLWANVAYSIDGETGRQVATFDMAELCRSVPVRNAVVEIIDIQWDGLASIRRSSAFVEELIARLESYLDAA